MRVKVLFFGMLKDVVGRSEESVELEGTPTAGAVFEHFAARYPRIGEMAASIVLARNREFCRAAELLGEGDELAFLPPVSGGAGEYFEEIREDGNLYALTRHPIITSGIGREILRGEDGAVVTFEGVVRNNTKGRPTRWLEYECYAPMAVKMMAQIGREIRGAQAIDRIAMVHRLGRMLIGETSVAVVATAPHRRAAFEAALEGINRLKRIVPIWKKEFFADGEMWVEGEWDASAPVAQGG